MALSSHLLGWADFSDTVLAASLELLSCAVSTYIGSRIQDCKCRLQPFNISRNTKICQCQMSYFSERKTFSLPWMSWIERQERPIYIQKTYSVSFTMAMSSSLCSVYPAVFLIISSTVRIPEKLSHLACYILTTANWYMLCADLPILFCSCKIANKSKIAL